VKSPQYRGERTGEPGKNGGIDRSAARQVTIRFVPGVKAPRAGKRPENYARTAAFGWVLRQKPLRPSILVPITYTIRPEHFDGSSGTSSKPSNSMVLSCHSAVSCASEIFDVCKTEQSRK
jgi:hypothetical protein